MLKKRILTAIILIPVFIYLVLSLSSTAFDLLTLCIVLLGAWEWSAFLGLKSWVKKLIYPIFILLMIFMTAYIPIKNLLLVTLIWWCSAFLLIITYPASATYWRGSIFLRAAMGILVLIPCWRAINFIHASPSHGPYLLLFVFVLIWGADSAAYFAGRKWGQHKLAPSVSPGKTWEGFWGAIGMTFLIVFALLICSKTPGHFWFPTICLSLIMVIFSIIGDLFESMLKREAGLKDSGKIMPGHGGVLDRIDSLTSAAPVFALGAMILNSIYS